MDISEEAVQVIPGEIERPTCDQQAWRSLNQELWADRPVGWPITSLSTIPVYLNRCQLAQLEFDKEQA